MEIFYTFIIISILGTLLHFTYDLSGKKIWVGIFSSVNESVWEHIKLLLTPIFLLETVKYVFQDQNNYFIRLLLMLLASITLTILFEYFITKYIKNFKPIFYISSFYITSLIVSIIDYIIKHINPFYALNIVSMIICLMIFILYLTFTIFPPRYRIFKDPITGTYGIPNM